MYSVALAAYVQCTHSNTGGRVCVLYLHTMTLYMHVRKREIVGGLGSERECVAPAACHVVHARN